MASPGPPPTPPAPSVVAIRPVGRLRPLIVGLIFWAALVPLAKRPRHSGNVWSRYMTIESLAERGTLAVDRSPLRAISGSPDLIKVGPHFYSDKPPVLPVLSAVVYEPLYLSGYRFGASAAQFVFVNWVMVLAVSGLGSALAVVGLRVLLQAAPVRPRLADALALAFGFGSLLLTYGVTFNNHSVAAGLVTMALAVVMFPLWGGRPACHPREGMRDARPTRRRGDAIAGLLASLAATIDLPAGGVMTAALGIWLAIRHRGVPWSYLAGCAGPMLAHGILQTLISGSPLPAEMTPELFAYKGSYWTTEAGTWRETGPRWRFGLELLFGPQGFITVTPVLIFGLAGIAWVATRRGDPLRPAAIVVVGGAVLLVAYYTWGVRRTDFAGLSFGSRHLLPIAPACFFFAVVLLGRAKNHLACVAFGLLVAIGVVYAWAGMIDPWSRVERRGDSGLSAVKRLTLYPWSSYRR